MDRRFKGLLPPVKVHCDTNTFGVPAYTDPPTEDDAIASVAIDGLETEVTEKTLPIKGNAPAACSLDACTSDTPGDWMELLPRSPLTPDRGHTFDRAALKRIADVTFVRLNIFPDGGVARLHVFSAIG